MIATTTRLNSVGAELARDDAVHAMTDITGFGLLGHGLEMARGSGLTLELWADEVPLLGRAAALARQGYVTGASQRNWASYGDAVALPQDFAEWRRQLLTDPQTSGGLLVAVAAARAQAVLETIRGAGFAAARIVGRAAAGARGITVLEAKD